MGGHRNGGFSLELTHSGRFLDQGVHFLDQVILVLRAMSTRRHGGRGILYNVVSVGMTLDD
jgi:hypothetical protein